MNCENCPLPCAKPHQKSDWYVLLSELDQSPIITVRSAKTSKIIRLWYAQHASDMISHPLFKNLDLNVDTPVIDKSQIKQIFLIAAITSQQFSTQCQKQQKASGALQCGGQIPTPWNHTVLNGSQK
ncbi:MAG: hypothetical protein ACWA5R_05575 [bacterium]